MAIDGAGIEQEPGKRSRPFANHDPSKVLELDHLEALLFGPFGSDIMAIRAKQISERGRTSMRLAVDTALQKLATPNRTVTPS